MWRFMANSATIMHEMCKKMNFFSKFFNKFFSDIISAIRIYPLGAIISLIATALLVCDVINIAFINDRVRFSVFMAFCLAFSIESVVDFLHSKFLQSNKFLSNKMLVKFMLFALIAVPFLQYIFLNTAPNAQNTPLFNLHYFSLCAIFVLIFIALKLCDCFGTLYIATIYMNFLGALCVILGVCLLIFAILCEVLFKIDIARFALSVEVCLVEAMFLLFLSTYRSAIKVRFTPILRILNVFASIYAIMFLIYFTLDVSRQSIVHLVVWYSFFALFLWWINMGRIEFDSLALDANKSKILRFLPLAVLFILNLIAFYAIIVRINQYGITSSRYFVVVGCITLLCGIIFSVFCKKPLVKSIAILIALIAFSAFSGAYNAINISISSQIKQLKIAQSKGDTERINSIKHFLAKYDNTFEALEISQNAIRYESFNLYGDSTFIATNDFTTMIKIKYDNYYGENDRNKYSDNGYNYTIIDDRFLYIYKNGEQIFTLDLMQFVWQKRNVIEADNAKIICEYLYSNLIYEGDKFIKLQVSDLDAIILIK